MINLFHVVVKRKTKEKELANERDKEHRACLTLLYTRTNSPFSLQSVEQFASSCLYSSPFLMSLMAFNASSMLSHS